MAFLEHILSAADMIKSDVEKKRQYQQQLGLTMAKMQAQNQREQQQQDAIAQRQQSQNSFLARNKYLDDLLKSDPTLAPEVTKQRLALATNPNTEIPEIHPQMREFNVPDEVVAASKGIFNKKEPISRSPEVLRFWENHLANQRQNTSGQAGMMNANLAWKKYEDEKKTKPAQEAKKNSTDILTELGKQAKIGLPVDEFNKPMLSDSTYQNYQNQILGPNAIAIKRGANPDSMQQVIKRLPTFQEYKGRGATINQEKTSGDSLAVAIKEFLKKVK